MTAVPHDVQRAANRSRRAARSRARQDTAERTALRVVRHAEVEAQLAEFHSGAAELPRPPHLLYDRCLAGHEPAEVLSMGERELLVAELVTAGWTDQQVSDHTRMTLYTTARIRARLELSPNHGPGEGST